MNTDNRKKVYDVLRSQTGYQDSYEDFNRAFDNDVNARKKVYDVLKSQTGYQDSYEDFDKLVGATSLTQSSNGGQPMNGSVAQQVTDEYDVATNSGGNNSNFSAENRLLQLIEENKDTAAKQPSLKEMVATVNTNNAKSPILSIQPNYTDNVRSERRDYAPVRFESMQYNPNADEDMDVDRIYTPKDAANENDVLDNYRNRFGLTQRGEELGDERSQIEREVSSKYLEEFKKTPEYNSIVKKKYRNQEEADAANKKLNDIFIQMYGTAISDEMQPYDNAYQNEVFNRYGYRINEDLRKLGKKNTSEQVSGLVKDIDSLLQEKHNVLKRSSGVGGNAMNALMGSTQYNQGTAKDRQELGILEASKRMLEQSQEIIAEAGKKGNTNFVAGFGRGLRDNFDLENFTFGLAEMAGSKYLNNAIEKANKGEELSTIEKKLLESSLINMATQAYFSSDLGRGYKSGQVTAESLPFMLEFIANPISGTGNVIAKGLLKYGLKRFGRVAASKGAKFAGRLIGDATAALGMEATSGLPRVVAGTLDRLNENYNYSFDNNGDLKIEKVGDVSFGKALGRSSLSTFFENQSEMVFNAFRGWNSPFLKAVDNVLPGHVGEFMQRIKNSKPGKLYIELKNNPIFKEAISRAQFHGYPEEYMEEVYNNFANVATGEMCVEDAIDLDNNIDTALGLAPTSLMFGMFGLGSMAAERYSNRRKMNKAFGKMNDEQRAKFEKLQQLSKKTGNEGIREFIKDIIKDKSLTQEQKRNEIEYAFEIAKANAIDDIQEAETEDTIEKETANIINFSDPSTEVYTEANRFVTDETGERISVPGYIVGYIGDAPIWQAEGSNERVTLKPGELDEASVQSMPTKEVIEATAGMIREEAQAQAEHQSKYSPDIIPPYVGASFNDGINIYEIVQQNPDGGWIANVTTTDGNGKQIQHVIPISDSEYYDIVQSQIDVTEAQSSQFEKSSPEYSDILPQENLSTENLHGNIPEGQQVNPLNNSLSENGGEQTSEIVIPSDDKGNLLYHQVPVDVTINTLNREELEPDEIDAFVSANKDAAAKLLKSLQDKAPKMGTNIAKYKADKLAWQGKVSDAQAQVNYWNSVSDEIAATRVQPGDKTAEAIISMGEPLNGEELAAMLLGTGRLPILYSSYKKETGGGNTEARGMVGLFANKSNGGMSIEEAGEQLMLADQENGTNFFDENDPNAGRNAIIDVLSGARTRGDLFNFIKENRERMAERERQAEYAAYEQWCADNFHMTPVEYEAYEEFIAKDLAERALSEDDYQEFISNLVDKQINQENEGNSGNEQAGVTGVREESDGVLQEEDVVPARGTGETVEGIGETDGGINSENGTLPKSTSGINSEIENARQEVDTKPTEAQKESGNYKKGHLRIDSYNITIENPKGSERSGIDANGNKWSVTMNNDYGYIRGTESVDGDHIDLFLSDNPTEGNVYVVDQIKEDGTFDEHKVMYGFTSFEEARAAYLSNYSPGWKGLGAITEVSKEEFKKWIDSSRRKTKAFADYESVKEAGAQNTTNHYTIEHRYHKKNGTYVYAVNFTERMDKEQFKELKSKAKNFNGYYSSFGKGGFIFETEEQGTAFADAVSDKSVSNNVEQGSTSVTETLQDIERQAPLHTQKESGNRLVTDERYAELKHKMQEKLHGQMNMGIDPEIFSIGTEMAVYHIEKGARKFVEYAKAMIEDLGDSIRPYLKAFYNGARDLPEMQELSSESEMDVYEDVSRFDVANFDKSVSNIFETAETIVREQEVEKQVKEVKKKRSSTKKNKENLISLFSDEELQQEHPDNAHNGYKIGDKVLYKGNEAIVHDFGSDERPVLDTGLAPVMYEIANYEDINPLNNKDDENRNSGTSRSLGKGTREETAGTERGGNLTGVHGYNGADQERSRGIFGTASSVESSVEKKIERNRNNYSFGENHIDVPSGGAAKLKANVEAIRTLREIEVGGNAATGEQKQKLARYVGWGGLANALDEKKYNNRNSNWSADIVWNSKYLPYYEQLKELLTPEEFRSAVQSTTTSHYTPEPVIRSLWNIVEHIGFKGGNISEPAMGIGHILGLMPKDISSVSQISGFEIDDLSGRISKMLYPDANVRIQGYETEFAPQSKDLVITNVPFGKDAPYDKTLDKSLRKKLGGAYNLHNYFIAKGLLELREGGLGVFVTSSATMDSADSRFREFVQGNNFDLIGAIRLPNDAFQKNAGTSVTADILVFRKRKAGDISNGVNFISTTPIGEGTYQDKGETRTKPIMVNEYFAAHPEMMLGEMMTAYDAGSGGLYSGASQTLKARPDENLPEALMSVVERFPKDIIKGVSRAGELTIDKKDTELKDGSLTVNGNNVYLSMGGMLEPIEVKSTFKYNDKTLKTVDAVQDYNGLKDILKRLIAAEQSNTINPEPIRQELNKAYDNFVKKYGTLNRNKALSSVFAEDFEHNLPFSLENVERVPSVTGKSLIYQVTKGKGILEKRVSFPTEEPTRADNLQDAMNISRSYRGSIDVPFIAQLTNSNEEAVIDSMLREGVAYRNPLTGELVDKDTYLSGNIKEKLEEARVAIENNPEFEKNVADLTNVLPEPIRFGDISYRLGTPWIPSEYVDKFAEDELGIVDSKVNFISVLNEYVIGKNCRVSDFAKSGLYQTERVGAVDLFSAALNQRKPKVYDEITTYDFSGKPSKVRVVNEIETQAITEKVMEISDKFIEYIDGQKAFHKELERIYNDKYNNFRLKEYSLPSFEHYPNSNTNISLRVHQKKAVQRSLAESTLLAHQVGTGKTFTMITTAMEMRRLKIAKKPMIVVQNATLEDFVKDFYKLYPGANILAPGKDERNAENRKRLFNLIATGDFDAIVIPQSFMQFIPDDEGRKKELIQQKIDEYEKIIETTEDINLRKRLEKEVSNLQDTFEGVEKKGKNRSVKDRAKAADRVKNKMERQLDRRTDDVMTFEQMGIDALFIDEAHNFKKIGFVSKMSNVKGIDTSASQRANSLLLKAKWIQEKNNGRNIILATGTPITNTMAEVWTMMNFVAPDILEAYHIESFDEFATTFGTVEPSLEFTATGNFKIADRFKSYVNVPELIKAFRSHADVVLTEDVPEFKENKNIPKLRDGNFTNIIIDKNEDLQDVMQTLIDELAEYNQLRGKEKKEKSALPLVVFTKAKQAAIDLRLLNPSFPDNPNSKTNQVVSQVAKLYEESSGDKGTQLIFCDSYQSPSERPQMDMFNYDANIPRFNLYDDIKQKLIGKGIPANEIAIVNDYDGEKRKGLFEKVRAGDVRVLIGSTEKMGVGVNVQDRLYALHHVDAPIRPMDFEQRNGRILRQGNMYAMWDRPVNVVTYGVQGTLDATAYDRLRIKQEFINQMMKGNVSGRVMEEHDDEDPSGMTFNQMAATLSGDKTAQLLFVAENKLKKLRNLKRGDMNSKSSMADAVNNMRSNIIHLEGKKRIYERAHKIVSEYFPEGIVNIKTNRKTITEKFGVSLDPIISAYDEAYSLNRGTAPLKISLNDNKAEAVIHFNEGRMVYELYAGDEHIVEGRQFNGGKGLISSIEHQLKATADNLSSIETQIASSEAKIEGLEKAMNSPWGREEELKTAEQEVSGLKKQLEEKAIANSKQNNEADTKRGYRVVNEEVNDYPNKLEVDLIIQNFKKQVNNHPEVHLLYAESDIENLSAYSANEQAISDLREALHNKSVIAAYVRSCNAIVAFPAHALDADEIESFLWHENTHYILHNNDIKDLDTLMSACFEYIKEKKPTIYNHIIENYSQEEWNEESVTYLVQDMFNNYGADKLLKSKFAGDSSVSSLFNQLFNEIKNGKSREHNKFRQDGDVLYGTTIRQNEKGGSIRKGLEEYSGEEHNQLRQFGITQTDGRTNGKRYGQSESGSGGNTETERHRRVEGGIERGTRELSDRQTGQELNYKKQFLDTLSSDDEGSDGTIEAYEEAVSGRKFQAREAYQDSMLALKKLQEVIERHSGKKLQSWENAYMAENQMSSKSAYEAEDYGKKFFKPMLEAVGGLMNKGASYRDVLDYMMAKHGLERNEVFALRDAKEASAKKFDKEIASLVREYKRMSIGKDEFETKHDELLSKKLEYEGEQYLKNQDKDYSGLTALTDEKKDFKVYALDIVNSFEKKYETQGLWDKVNAATKETLHKSYESGMMSKDMYEKLSKMFNYYIPLRGWNETTAEDVYEYLSSEISPVNSVLKSAYGRTSIADDPLATIGNMAESTILQGNRNMMKQNFLNMVVNHPSDIATMSEAWYVMDPASEEWSISFPDIEEGDDADTIAQKITAHAGRMSELEKEGYATKVKEGLNINYHILQRQAQEHIVNVKRNGKEYLIFINGNPRAAQAVNGLTNPDTESNEVLSGISQFNRQLAANFTTRNPAFVFSNLFRDLIFSLSAVSVKEKPLYAARYIANIPKSIAIVMRNITEVEKDRGTRDKIFEEFLANGGETGYTALHNVDEYKRMIRKEMNYNKKTDYFKAIKACAGFFSMMNRCAEDVSRFNAYMTSREEGRTITEAISDAKEITVNFNKKGAGYKSGGFFGSTAGIFRNLFLFFNAGVQSLANFGLLAKKNRKGFVTLLGGFTTAGFVVPVLNQLAISLIGDDGDDDYYNNLPDWVRRNNLCIYTGKGTFLTIPLPIELRAFYGLGEMAYQETIGRNGSKGDEIAYQAINQLTELLPINPLGNNGDLVTTFMPDALKPFWQVNENMDFTGKPIYRENSFNKNMPEWTKTYKGTSEWLVNLSEWTNEMAGGDKYKKADAVEPIMNWNPAKIEHLFESYFGGMAKTVNQTAKTLVGGMKSVIEGEIDDNIQWRNAPVVNRFVNDAGDDRSSFGKINQRYYKLYDLYDDVRKNLRGYSKEVAKGNLEYLDKLEKLYKSDDYKVYLKFKENKRQIDKIKKIEEELPKSEDEEKKKIQLEMMKLKKTLLQQLEDK